MLGNLQKSVSNEIKDAERIIKLLAEAPTEKRAVYMNMMEAMMIGADIERRIVSGERNHRQEAGGCG